jgi:hypothetical protein
MQIDRSNYEIWLVDWLDGNLSEVQIEQLLLFLSRNPALNEDFNELVAVTLKSSGNSFPDKEHLKKSTADLSFSQFEYLSVAFLENDLSSGQQTELFEALGQDPEKKRSFELIQKTKLTPPGIIYKDKYKLKKSFILLGGIRLSVIGLSTAATIALLMIAYFLIPRNLDEKGKDGRLAVNSQNIGADSTRLQIDVNKLTDRKEAEFEIFMPDKIKVTSIATVRNDRSNTYTVTTAESIKNDSSLSMPYNTETVPQKIPVFAKIDMRSRLINNSLMASDATVSLPVYDEERSKLGRFIAKTFREKILREKVSKDQPLQGYEIAEAGVTGLNKLFGWEMALEERNDENGELKSVYFSSKLLKFNAPVKKSEPGQ